MTVSLRFSHPCDRCEDGKRLCELLRQELIHSVGHIADLSAFCNAPLPEGEVIFDCRSFRPKGSGRVRVGWVER